MFMQCLSCYVGLVSTLNVCVHLRCAHLLYLLWHLRLLSWNSQLGKWSKFAHSIRPTYREGSCSLYSTITASLGKSFL